MSGRPDTPPSAADQTSLSDSEPSVRTAHERARRAGPWVIRVAISAITIALGVWGGLQWSLISEKADDRIAQTSWAEEGPAFKVLNLSGGRNLTIDDSLLTRLGGPKAVIGKRLQTDPLSTTAHIDDRTVRLRWSATSTRTVVVLLLMCAIGALRATRWHRTPVEPDKP